MRQLTIVPDDNIVVVDGMGIQITFDCDPDIHAIQWDAENEVGTIEYKSNKDNLKIGALGIAEFLPLVDSHGNEKTRIDNERELEEKKIADYEALPSTKISREFSRELPIGDQLSEILKYIDGKGDADPKLKAMINKSKEIKDRFPKEGE